MASTTNSDHPLHHQHQQPYQYRYNSPESTYTQQSAPQPQSLRQPPQRRPTFESQQQPQHQQQSYSQPQQFQQQEFTPFQPPGTTSPDLQRSPSLARSGPGYFPRPISLAQHHLQASETSYNNRSPFPTRSTSHQPIVSSQQNNRSGSVSSTTTTGSRNFSRPVLMYASNPEPLGSGMPAVMTREHAKSESLSRRQPVQLYDDQQVSPIEDDGALSSWFPTGMLSNQNSNNGSVSGINHTSHVNSQSQSSSRLRKPSGSLAVSSSQPYNSRSDTSTPPASDGGISSAAHSQDLNTPETELLEIQALSLGGPSLEAQPVQQTVHIAQHAQFHSAPQTMMPEVAVYHVAGDTQPHYGQANYQQHQQQQPKQQQQQPHYRDASQASFVGEPGPLIEDSIEQLPQSRFPQQYQQYQSGSSPQHVPQGPPPQHLSQGPLPQQQYGPGQSLGPDMRRSPDSIPRPHSTNTLASSNNSDPTRQAGHRTHLSAGPGTGTPSPMASPMLRPQMRGSPENRPQSYIDLLQTPYAQQVAPSPNLDNSFLRSVVGKNASLLEASKTLDAYRANVKNIQDPAIQYEFAVFMVQTALEMPVDAPGPPTRADLIRDARGILQKLVDKSYPFAQYYLADGYASGLFNKGKEDYDRAFPLFQAAAKRGHAEAAYRAALCYELGWGCRKDYSKAVRFYEMSASKNHPGAATRLGLACLNDLMGLSHKYREGCKWLKRAAESADAQYNAAPYELAKLHENGFGPDIFKDEAYAAQLFTESANLGHPDANLVMGKAYEHGYLGCPQDALLSIHFYTGAANAGEPEGMMALCAWYLFGAPPLLEKDDGEAFEWAKRAADFGFAKAEYAVGYFKEMGIGCHQDTMEANHWYWRAAQQGDERAKQRMKTIAQAVSGGKGQVEEGKGKKTLFGKKLKK